MVDYLGNHSDVYSHQLTSSSSGSVLYLFRPRQMRNQYRRTMVYNFDGQFVDHASKLLSNNQMKANDVHIDQMLSRPEFLASFLPASDNMAFIQLDALSYNWTFILVVDNDIPNNSKVGLTGQLANNRIIYSGYFTDEPKNPLSHGGATYNLNAHLIITHKTMINKLDIPTPHGNQVKVDTVGDADIVVPIVLGHLTTEPQYATRPHDLVHYSVMGSEGNYYPAIGEQHSITVMESNPVLVDSKLNMPRTNLRHILSGVTTGVGSVQMQGFGGTMYPEPNLGNDTVTTSIELNLQSNSHLSHVGLRENESITLQDIVARYNPKVEDFDAKIIPMNIADQSETSASNMFSALLTSTVPSILANCGLADFIFFYHSPAAGTMESPWDIRHFGSLLPMGSEDLNMRLRVTMRELEMSIFPLLKENRGHFDLMGHFTVGGTSQVRLNFLCDRIRNDAIYEVPTVLGGFNSPLIGNARAAVGNSCEINTLIRNITDTGFIDTNKDLENQYRVQQAIDNMERNHYIKRNDPDFSNTPPDGLVNYL